MPKKEKKSNLARLHQKYYNSQGMELPGGSTIANLLDKSGPLIGSAVKLTKEGFDYKKIWDFKKDIGTLTHYLILCDLQHKTPDLKEYSKEMLDKAENCLLSYFGWLKDKTLNAIHLEKPLVSEKMLVGGTVDYFGLVNGVHTLVDYKTGGLWESAYIQIAGYEMILKENGFLSERVLLLNVPRDENDKYQEVYLTDKERKYYGDIFKKLCEIWWLKKEVKREEK